MMMRVAPAARCSFLPAFMMTYLILVLQFVCLSFWIGGTTVLIAVVAPSSFRMKPLEAVELVTIVLKRYGGLLAGLQVFLLATLYLQLMLLSDSIGLKLRLALSITSLAMLLTVYLRFTVLPRAEMILRHSGEPGMNDSAGEDVRGFGRTLGRSLTLLSVNLFLGLCVVIILILPF